MPPVNPKSQVLDPVDLLNVELERAWSVLCTNFDVTSGLPEFRTLFEGANLASAEQTAETVIANMLLDIMDSVSRFSSWYRMPGRAFGLISIRDNVTKCMRWILAPEATQQWSHLLHSLSLTTHKYTGLIKAIILIEGRINEFPEEECYITASCNCSPPHSIVIKKSILENARIVCDACQRPYT